MRPGQFCLYMLGLHADLMKLWVQMPMERYARSARCFCLLHLKRALTLRPSRAYTGRLLDAAGSAIVPSACL